MRRVVAMVVLITANFMDLMDTTVVNVALPSIRSDLGMTAAQLEWVVSAYTLGLAATLIAGGRLGDLHGRRTVFLVGVIGFTLASLLSAVAGSGEMLVLARAVQGGFAGAMVPQVLTSVQDLYEPQHRGPVFGLVGFVTGTASVVGPILAGWLVSSDAFGIGWRSIFAINVPVGVAIVLAALWFVPNGRSPAGGGVDVVGAALATGAAVGVVLPLVEGRQAGWPAWCGASLALAAVLVVALVRRERALEARPDARRVPPFVPLHLFRNRGFVAGSLANFTFQAGLVAFFLFLALYLQQALGFTPIAAGLTWLGFSLGALAGSALASTPRAASARRVLMSGGAALSAIGTAWVASVAADPALGAAPTGWTLTPGLAVAGVGMGTLIVPLYGAILETVDPVDAGGASGTLNTLQQIGGALGVAAIGAVFFTVAGDVPTPSSLTAGFHWAAWLAAGLFALASLATVGLGTARAGSRRWSD